VRTLDERETTLARRDERIALLEGEKQELTWRLAEYEERLRQTIGRAVIADSTGRAQADELDAARSSRAKAFDDFQRAAGAHVDEVTALRASLAEQEALAAELEDGLRAAEVAAAAAKTEAESLRKNTKGLEEADRARRTRLAELEGKLLRLEHEKKQATSASAGASGADTQALERRLADVTASATRARERELRANLARVMAAAAESAEALARATAELAATRARATSLEADVARGKGRAPGGNGHDASANSIAAARELAAVEAGLRDELQTLAQIETALAEEIAKAEPAARPDAEQGADVILLHTTLANYRRHAARLRDELEGIRQRLDSLSVSDISGYLEELGEDLAEMEE
jgi:hypothetical protein